MMSKTMALWVAPLLVLSISLWSCTTADNDGAADCCLTTSNRKIPSKVVVSFNLQTSDGPCRIPATIFVTKKGRKLCTPFPTKDNWVSDLIQQILDRNVLKRKPEKPRGEKHGKK